MQQIGRYQVLGELGRGAMGIVYKALDPAIGRTIAIKSIRLSELSDEAERERLRERLVREAQSAGILSHPGIVTIYDIAEQDGMAYIFMEFVNGPPLEKMLRHELTPDKETLLSIFRQTAAALDYAHRKGIVHRDVKPANIMIHEDGAAKVTDFGVAKIVSQKMTQSGMIMGTPSYMSPEQVQGSPVSGASDQFSLGVIAYEVMTGERPFTAEYLPTLLYKIVRDDPAPARRLNPTLASSVESVLYRALAKHPEDRFDNCTAFVNALASACAEAPSWTPLPRGASSDIPTGGGSAENAPPLDQEVETLAVTLPPVPRSSDRIVAPVLSAPAVLTPPPMELVAEAAAVAVQPVAERTSLQPTPPPMPVEEVVETMADAPVEAITPPAISARVLRSLPEPEAEPNGARKALLRIAIAAVVVIAGYFGYQWLQHYVDQPPPVKPAATSTSAPQPDAPAPPPPAAAKSEPAKPEQPPSETAKSVPPVVTRPKGPAGPQEAAFQLTTRPEGAEVVFDGILSRKCVTPCSLTLDAGRHTYVVTHAGYRERHKIIEVPRDAGDILDLEKLGGTLSVTSNPAGLAVIIDGVRQQQRTPLRVFLAPGPHQVQVVNGDATQDFPIDMRDGALLSKMSNWTQ